MSCSEDSNCADGSSKTASDKRIKCVKSDGDSKLMLNNKEMADDVIDEAAMNILNGEDFTLEPTTVKTRSGRNKDHVKRPMNAFMVYAQVARKLISKSNSNLQNSEISKKLGELWRRTDEASKRVFIERAEILRQNHKKEHPDYKYQPRRKKSKGNPHSRSRSRSPSSSNSDNQPQINVKPRVKKTANSSSRLNGNSSDYKLMEKTISNAIHDYDNLSHKNPSCNYNATVYGSSYSSFVDDYHYKSQCQQPTNRFSIHAHPASCSPSDSIHSVNSNPDPSQPLTPPATPSSILLTNKAAISPHSANLNPVKVEAFKSSPAQMSPVSKDQGHYLVNRVTADNTSHSPSDPYHHQTARSVEFYRNYNQTYSSFYQNSNPNPQSWYSQPPPVHVVNFQTGILETDVDPKEMEQYLDGPGQTIKKVPTFNHCKADENLLLELQSAPQNVPPNMPQVPNSCEVSQSSPMVIYPMENHYQNPYTSSANWDYSSYPNL